MLSLRALCAVLGGAVLACAAPTAAYRLADTYDQSNWMTSMDFFTGTDPTHGFVQYVGAGEAQSSGLLQLSGEGVYMGVDYTTANPSGGRKSVRVQSKKTYTTGLFIADIAHMPGSICGVWPAWWTCGGNWPNQGEIDIIEGVHMQQFNAMTLHTSAGCNINSAGSSAQLLSPDCNDGNANTGCSEHSANQNTAYGDGFNNQGGGVWAMEWTTSSISVWMFPRNAIPTDIQSGNPNPAGWGTPMGRFGDSGCNFSQHFTNHGIIFDTTFCGDWAGNVWSQFGQCQAKAASCQDYVANHPSDFKEAYWAVHSVKVYQSAAEVEKAIAQLAQFGFDAHANATASHKLVNKLADIIDREADLD